MCCGTRLFLGTRSGIWSAWFPLWFLLSDWAGHPIGFHCWLFVFRQSWDLWHDLYGIALLSRDGPVPLPVVWPTHFRWCFSLRPCSRMFPQLALPANTGAFQRPTASTEGGRTCDSPTVFFNIDYLLIIYWFFLYNYYLWYGIMITECEWYDILKYVLMHMVLWDWDACSCARACNSFCPGTEASRTRGRLWELLGILSLSLIIKGSFSSKTSQLRTIVVGSILTNMSTTSSCQPHHHHRHRRHHHHQGHQVVWKCNRTGTREFRFDKTLGRETPCFLSGKVASVVAEVGALFPRFRASICKSCTQNAHRIVARAQFHIQLWWPTELQNDCSRLN